MSPSTPDQAAGPCLPSAVSAPLLVPLIEETAVVTRKVVKTGRVRLTKTMTEQPEKLPP